MKSLFNRIIRRLGYDLVRYPPATSPDYLIDFTSFHKEVVATVQPFTITSPERIHALVESVRYVVGNHIEGDIVECGVYKGGSMMAAALTLLNASVHERTLYLFDTFEGMPKPEEMDVDAWGNPASEVFAQHRRSDTSSSWVECPEDLVLDAMLSTGYPAERIRLVKGLVEERLPHPDLERIALLRLDTDWYKSTLHELKCLYPLVVDGGVVIVDDYGHFAGSRQAVDEYFSSIGELPYLHRIDYSGRLLIKRSRR